MNQHLLPALAQQHVAELRDRATGGRRSNRDRVARPSLRVRTGWTLVNLGLRLVTGQGQGLARQPRTADSC
ncbi:MAG TPA: hypothetical protein VEH05_15485 [Streptosporangiaceae bacterium]|nr:hypothetical protein [Streptosporangiaceae bacterium]